MNTYKRGDVYTRNAKAQGYPARSVFKLEEIDRRCRLLRQGLNVVDLGAAPGSWSLYTIQKIGPKGKLLSVDIQPLAQILPPPAVFVQADIRELDQQEFVSRAPFDLVLSDMAPNTTGNRLTDQSRSFELFSMALEVAAVHGAVGSHFVGKIFMGGDFEEARKRLRELFEEERIIRPPAVRSNSIETFLVGLRRRA